MQPIAQQPYFGGPSVHTLRVELQYVEPAVWRRFVLPSDTKLPKFNRMLEAVVGWQGYHLHMFEIADLRFGHPDEQDDELIDERRITVRQILPRAGSVLLWAYDFGDYWRHDVIVEAIEELSPDARYPMCTDGAQACPPEDCGGVGGYEELRKVLGDPADPEHDHMREWAGAEFDADTFDQMAVTKRLRRIR